MTEINRLSHQEDPLETIAFSEPVKHEDEFRFGFLSAFDFGLLVELLEN